MDYLRRVEGLPLTTVRPFTVFGPSESTSKLIPHVIGRALRGERIDLASGTQVRDYVYVSDVIDALLLAMDTAPGGIFNIGAGPAGARTVRVIVETLLDIMGVPLSLCRFGEAERSRIDPAYLVSDPSRAARDLGWKPRVPLIEGLRNTVACATHA
jgi:nucleoside-diphosphate-sugar epimerase